MQAGAVVTSVGDGVTNLREGDRVAIEPGVPCRACNYCKTGVYNLCPQMSFCATPPVHGNLCRWVTSVLGEFHDIHQIIKILCPCCGLLLQVA